MTRVDWTDAELRAALLMRRRGDSLREIAGACGKSVYSARKKLGELEALAARAGRAGAAGGERRRVL